LIILLLINIIVATSRQHTSSRKVHIILSCETPTRPRVDKKVKKHYYSVGGRETSAFRHPPKDRLVVIASPTTNSLRFPTVRLHPPRGFSLSSPSPPRFSSPTKSIIVRSVLRHHLIFINVQRQTTPQSSRLLEERKAARENPSPVPVPPCMITTKRPSVCPSPTWSVRRRSAHEGHVPFPFSAPSPLRRNTQTRVPQLLPNNDDEGTELQNPTVLWLSAREDRHADRDR
jgi:hypothetical protein